MLKWKKVLEDCFIEYWGFMGSKEGVSTSFPSRICAFSKLPESKLEFILIVDPQNSSENTLCRDSIIIYLMLLTIILKADCLPRKEFFGT